VNPLLVLEQRTYALVPSTVSGGWCMTCLHAALTVIRLDSSPLTFHLLDCSMELNCYSGGSGFQKGLESILLAQLQGHDLGQTMTLDMMTPQVYCQRISTCM